MSRKTGKSKKNGKRFHWMYILIGVIFLYVVIQSFFLAQSSSLNYVVAQRGDLGET